MNQHDSTEAAADSPETLNSQAAADPQEIPVVRGPVAARAGLLRIGTRGSTLAVTQTRGIAARIADATGAEVVLVIITTHGDVTTAPLAQLGGTGVFVSALRDALLDGRCDLAVHSLKDLPTAPYPGIMLGAIPERVDARDALCARDGLDLASLPLGAAIGTGSPRRSAQLLSLRPDLDVREIRGNVDTRLGRVGQDLDAVVLAAAGLERIGRTAAITERFPLDRVPTAPGQGALALEARIADATDGFVDSALAAVDDPASRAAALAERALLQRLEAGCAAPVGAWARAEGESLVLTGAVYRADGGERMSVTRDLPLRSYESDESSRELGFAVADALFEEGVERLGALGGRR